MFQKPGATRASSSVGLALAVVVMSAIFACSDATAPEKLQVEPSPAQTISSRLVTIVTPEDMHGWAFVHDGTGKPCSGAGCQMVSGPGHPPFGSGSAELSATNGSESSLLLTAFQGTRLDQLTALRYNAYRASHDAAGTLAVSLVLNVKFDLGAASNGDVGQLVFDPARTPGASAPDSVWQHFDARAGLWWATRQAAHVGEGADAHPCVESHPCTWSEILERFPNIGIASDGGVLLSARKGAEFTGNVDSLVVGVAGVNSAFDFELVPRRTQYVLKSQVQDGAIAGQFPSDTLFDEGTAVSYSFTSRPGRAEPLLVLDDTLLLPASGQIVMDGAHSLQVVSDTAYSYETMTPMEKRIAELTQALLSSSDKLSAVSALNSYYVDQVNAGVDPAELARAEKVAQFVVVDPVRDAAAMDAVDDALTGITVQYQKGWDQIYTSITRDGDPPATAAATRTEVRSVAPRAPASPPPVGTFTASPGPNRNLVSVQNMEDPREYTRILYMNGIWTSRDESWASTLLLANAAYKLPRFANYRTRVTMYYNPTRSAEMKAWDAAHPCELRFKKWLSLLSTPLSMAKYAVCSTIRFAKVATTTDLVESIIARVNLATQWQPSNADAAGFARAVSAYRAQNWHVLAVGHSEGTILEAQSIRWLAASASQPLEVANRCITVLALAPATSRASYGLDEYHVMGLLAEHDIIRLTLPIGWESVSTSLTRSAGAVIAAMSTPSLAMAATIAYGRRIHEINETYLGSEVLPITLQRLAQEHRECVPASANLQLSAPVVQLGDQFGARLDILNQNDRPLLGRTVQLTDGYAIARTDAMTFKAMVPAEKPWPVNAIVSEDLAAYAPVTIPLIAADYQFVEEQHSQWVVSGEMNVSLPDGTTWSDVGPAPTSVWDGTVSGCTNQRIRKYGELGNWREWELKCSRIYRPIFLRPDTLPTGRPMSYSLVHWTTPAGIADSAKFTSRTQGNWYYYCGGAAPCISSSYLEHAGPVSVVARSPVLTPVVAVSAAPALAVNAPTPSSRVNGPAHDDALMTRRPDRARSHP